MLWIIRGLNTTIIFALILLSACGGGSGSDSEQNENTNSDSPPPTAPPSEAEEPKEDDNPPDAPEPSSDSGGNPSGEALFVSRGCLGCHGENGNGSTPIDTNKDSYGGKSLSEFIVDTMPPSNPALCESDCAEDIARYIQSWTQDAVNQDPSLASCDQVTYGPRMLRVLTKNELSNSVRDLTGVNIKNDLGQNVIDTLPADNLINDFSNNVLTNIESGTLQAYGLVVDKIVEKLAETNFRNIFNCEELDAETCAANFINNFAPKVYRRPLNESEVEALNELFDPRFTGGNVYEGIALMLRTIFTSPQFLYRDETGVSVADINAGTSGDGDFVQDGEIQNLITDSESPQEVVIYQRFEGNGINFTGDDLIVVNVSGTQGAENNLWPTLSISVNNEEIANILVDHSFPKTYQFHATGISGNGYIAFINQQVGANEEYKGGHNLNLFSVEISAAKENTLPQPDRALDDDAFVLTPHQIASFLSFTFAGTTPDDSLLAAAAARELETDEQITAQIERLLNTASARQHFGDYAAQWLKTDKVLGVIKDSDIYPSFTAEVREAMAQEVREIFNHVVLDEGEGFTSLFDGNFTFANGTLADFYGISGVFGEQMQKVSDVNSRAGLVTSGAFLAVNAHEQDTAPILRAVRLRRRFLCHDVPAPPTGVSLSGDNFDEARADAVKAFEEYLAENNGVATAKRKYEFQTSAALCQTCHAEMINPLGFGFESFDAVGLAQSVDFNGLDVDAQGTLYGVSKVGGENNIEFNGAIELAHSIANLDVTRQCFIDSTFRLAMGTGSKDFDPAIDIQLSLEELNNYSCEVQKLDQVMSNNNLSTRALLKALGSMDSVRYRKNIKR